MNVTDPYHITAVSLSILAVAIAGAFVVWGISGCGTPFLASIWDVLENPTSTSGGVAILVVAAMVAAGLCAIMAVRSHATLVNWTALYTILPMLVLGTSRPECNPVGSVATGVMMGFLCASTGWAHGWVSRSAGGTGGAAGTCRSSILCAAV